MPPVPRHFKNFKCSTPHNILTIWMYKWNSWTQPVLKNMQADSLAFTNWVVFLKPRQVVKRNNAEFTNASRFTSPVMCSTHLTLLAMTLLALPTCSNFVLFVFVKIPGESAWGVLFRPAPLVFIDSLATAIQQNLIHFNSRLLISENLLPLAKSFCMLFLVCV